MFASADEVYELTGFSVDDRTIRIAQGMVEMAAGRVEGEITRPSDLTWMKYAIAYQAAYIEEDPKKIFEQANIESVSDTNNKVVFGDRPAYLSPLTVDCIKRLSFRGNRTIQTGPILLGLYDMRVF